MKKKWIKKKLKNRNLKKKFEMKKITNKLKLLQN